MTCIGLMETIFSFHKERRPTCSGKPASPDLMIVGSNCSRPRRPIQVCCRRRGRVPDIAGIQPRPRSCANAWFPSLLAGRRRAVPPITSGARSVRWMSHGACRQADPELFFPIGAAAGPAARQVQAAKAICAPCAVRANCLSYALDVMPEGIWGGTTLEERRTARRRLVRRLAGPRDELDRRPAALTDPDPENAGARSSGLPGLRRWRPGCPSAVEHGRRGLAGYGY